MKELTFRPLTANEIECRVGNTIKEKDQSGKVVKDQYGNDKIKGFFLLLYKNARVDANILDDTLGVFNWQKRFYQVKNTMVCEILINANYDKPELEPRWIAKSDGGDDDSQMEQVKSELSDSFKRASFCVGVGRELYYSPKIYIECKDGNDHYAHYTVKNIEYDKNKRITNLAIINDKTKKVVFLYGKDTKVADKAENEPKNDSVAQNEERGSIDKNDLKMIQAYLATYDQVKSTKVFEWLEKKYGTMNPEFLTLSQGKEVLKIFGGKQ